MAVLTSDAIRATNDRKLKQLTVAAWGGDIYLGSLRLGERNRLLMRWAALDTTQSIEEMAEVQVDLIIAVACDADGAPLFKAEDAEWLADKDAATVMEVAEACMAFLGFSVDAHEEAVKNSESTLTDVTRSALPENSA